MKLSEIEQIEGEIVREVAAYRDYLKRKGNGRGIVAGCLWTSRDMAVIVQDVIHRSLPQYSLIKIAIEVGNYVAAGSIAFVDDDECKRRSNSLPPVGKFEWGAPYHAWLKFGDMRIDLSLLYTMLDGETAFKEFTAAPFYQMADETGFPYNLDIKYFPYAIYEPPPPYEGWPGLEVVAQPDGFEKPVNFLSRIKCVGQSWMNALRRNK